MFRRYDLVGFLIFLSLCCTVLWGRTTADNAAMKSRSARGLANTSGSLISITELTGQNVTHAVVVKNDETSSGTLLVKANPTSVGPSGIPTPTIQTGATWTLGSVVPLLPGESLTLDQGTQSAGVRAETTGTVACRVIVTFK